LAILKHRELRLSSAFHFLLLVLPGILIRLGYFRGLDLDGVWKTPFMIQFIGDEIAWSSTSLLLSTSSEFTVGAN
jgi:hypothetical protein